VHAEHLLHRNLTTTTVRHEGMTLRGWVRRPTGTAATDTNSAPVLFVHGFGDSATGPRQLFVQAADALAAVGRASYAFDRLGHGVSDGSFTAITLRDEVDQVVAMTEHVAEQHGGRVHLAAHSLGAVESAIAAARLPQLVATLTLWSPAGVVVDDITVHDEIQGQPLASVRERGWFDFGGMRLGTSFIDDVRDGLDVYAEAAGYAGPVDVVHGTADTIVPVEYGERYGRLLPGATFTPVDGADHAWSSLPSRDLLIARLLALVCGPRP
jgi:pimeloyl-ACP methyl ester carboxylesterase